MNMGNSIFNAYTVVITGANSGIGLETARTFLDQGARVFGLDLRFRNTDSLGQNFIPIICDVTDQARVQEAVSLIRSHCSKVDVLVTNAGKVFLDTIADLNYKKLDSCYEVHLKHHMVFIKELLPLLQKSLHASVICVSSAAGGIVTPEELSYGIMKEAVIHLVRSCTAAFDRIRFNAVCPGLTRTHLMPSYMFDILEGSDLPEKVPLHRLGRPSDTAKLIAFLASEKAAGINGAVIIIDGGYSVNQPQIYIR